MAITTNEAIDHLRGLGYSITAPPDGLPPYERPVQLQARLGVPLRRFHARLHHPACPAFPRLCSDATGRLLKLRCTPELHAWLTRPAQPRKALA
jgi:hypothetical protein